MRAYITPGTRRLRPRTDSQTAEGSLHEGGGGILRRLSRSAAAAGFWLLVWTLAARLVGIEFILPAPLTVWQKLVELSGSLSFWRTTLMSLQRILLGYLAGAAIGVALAVFCSVSRAADLLIEPVVRIMRAAPVASFIILVQLWMRRAAVPGAMAAMMVVPVVWESLRGAIAQTDPELLEMARAYRFGMARTLRLVYIPSVLPELISACVTAQGLAWKSGVAAEVLCVPPFALGTMIYHAKQYLDTPALFAWTAVTIALSIILEHIFAALMRKIAG